MNKKSFLWIGWNCTVKYFSISIVTTKIIGQNIHQCGQIVSIISRGTLARLVTTSDKKLDLFGLKKIGKMMFHPEFRKVVKSSYFDGLDWLESLQYKINNFGTFVILPLITVKTTDSFILKILCFQIVEKLSSTSQIPTMYLVSF